MSYSTTLSELQNFIEDITEQTFTTTQLNLFIQQAERKIFQAVDATALRSQETKTLGSGAEEVILPTDYLYMYGVNAKTLDNKEVPLLRKDETFIREAYPFVSGSSSEVTGTPVHYAITSDGTKLLVGPRNGASIDLILTYAGYPASIVDTNTSSLGNRFLNVLLNGALVEAARFMKAEQDIIANYDKMFMESLAEYKMLGDGKNKQDTYRSGQIRVPVA